LLPTLIIIIRPHRIVDAAIAYTDGVVWSVCRSRSWALQKPLNRSRCCLGCGLGWGQVTLLDGVHIPPVRKGNF